MYKHAISKLLEEVPNFTTMKVYLKLCEMQDYDDRPINATKKAISDELRITYYHVHNAFKWLTENNYIAETRENGQSRFWLNPHQTTCGRNRKQKVHKWDELKKKGVNIIDLGSLN